MRYDTERGTERRRGYVRKEVKRRGECMAVRRAQLWAEGDHGCSMGIDQAEGRKGMQGK